MMDMNGEITDYLLKCSSMSDRGQRDVVLELMPPEIKQNIKRQDVDRVDAICILIACLKYPYGIEKLSDAIHAIEGNSVPWKRLDAFLRNRYPTIVSWEMFKQLQVLLSNIHLSADDLKRLYADSAPPGWPAPEEDAPTKTLGVMVATLADAKQQTDGAFPILKFVENLQYAVQEPQIREDLKIWNDSLAHELGAEREITKLRHKLVSKNACPPKNSSSSQSYLLVKLEPDLLDQEWFKVYAWFLENDNDPGKNLHVDEEPRKLDTIPKLLKELLIVSHTYVSNPSSKPIVELFLPHTFFCYDFDQWLLETGLQRLSPITIEYPIVVRSLERTYNKNEIMYYSWKQKWGEFIANITSIKPLSCSYTDFFDSLPKAICLTMTFAPATFSDTERSHILSSMISAGIPVALWPKKQIDSLSEKSIREAYNSLLLKCDFSALPIIIWHKRLDALKEKQRLVHYLTLLWDDPNRLPPDAKAEPLRAPMKRGQER